MPDSFQQSEALVQARIDIVALEKTVEGMGREIGEIKDAVTELTRTVNGMRDQLTEARGGWRTLMALGGASATFGGALAWLVEHLMNRTP
jgi:hypothetical protein